MFQKANLKVRQLVEAVLAFAQTREPVVVISGLAGAVTTFVVENQGDLTGTHAWVAVAWAGVTWLMRHYVSPAKDS
jgi:hypothetical protein